MEVTDKIYRIKMTVAVYRNKKLVYRNELIIPGQHVKRSEARVAIKTEINNRLQNSNFFISPRVDFDLVRYTHEASCNTYIRYRIIEKEAHAVEFKKEDSSVQNLESLAE